MSQFSSQLPEAGAGSYTRSRHLPPYRGIVAVDAKDFTGYPAIEHGVISQAIPELLRVSLQRAGIGEVWDDRRFPASTGDGYVFGFEPRWMPLVIHPWLNILQDVLAEFNVHSTGAVRIRLRVSLHIGPLPDSGAEFDGNGTPRNDTHRLLDSRPVKAMLAASNEHTTQVAAILSDRCHQDAVASGYTGRHPDHFIEVPATVEGKRFDQRAWLYVPAPSGNLYDRRVLGDQVVQDTAARPTTPSRQVPNRSVTNKAPGGNVNTGTVHGGQSVSNIRTGGDHVGGNKAGTVRGNQGDTVHGDKNERRQ
ncbi:MULTISPECIES: hypothetical protein [Streptomycetaceae]|uniref:Uncharacterized protein n=1 Tax=Streptantibioticus cattleyicolor (strain ATCC 35852 / DSM 46488 / JCM 4925 / NBRC 14057 / NRRL 8057) TaxID=1003195 RepID=F8JQ54_STREN|nr:MULTISPECIES: hypothetical protein [Streptomycetaceae]AEW95320.1 hypothetical protein SCATT_29490 [Streptantibioticus cattleyicolor NRRL 8057 = DSM 46488]MYS59899.1 hypothetical protein [Streptomyces sp. SID5468]CCB75662.1 conserved protein of unknown function [Streptantibioticus cattleyicolor NRRL 8057 = DSM 46488]